MNKLISIFLFAYFVYAGSAQQPSTTTRRPTRFTIKCAQVQYNELLFDGACNFEKFNIYPRIMEILEIIREADQESSLNMFLSNELFKNSTFFFENKYKDRQDFMDKLKDFQTQLKNILRNMKISLSEVYVQDFVDALQKSKFDSVISTVIRERDDYVNLLAFNDTERLKYNCQNDENFCQNSAMMFNITFSNQLNGYTIKNFLDYLIDKSFTYINQIIYLPEKREIEKIFSEWDKKGTDEILMSEVKNLTNKKLISEILYVYQPLKTTKVVQRTSRETTTKNTTIRIKVIDEVAVSSAVIWTVPFVILGLGIISMIASMSFFYGFKPVQTHQRQSDRNIINRSGHQYIEMNKPKSTV